MADASAVSTSISDDEEEEVEADETEPLNIYSTDNSSGDNDNALMDTRDMSTYWKKEIGAMTDPPTGWPLESYISEDATKFLTTRLQTVASDTEMVRVLSPNQYPYDIMYCLFVVRPVKTLRMCLDNMRETYKETIDHLFDKLGLLSNFSCVVFTLATNKVSHRSYSDNGNDQYKFVIYQINSESDIFHVELWQSQTNRPEGYRSAPSLYMSWHKTMHDRTKAIKLTKLVAVTKRVEAITELANRGMGQCVPMKMCDNDTNVRVTVVSHCKVSVGQHVLITDIQTPTPPNINWAVQVLQANSDNKDNRQLYTHVLGRGTFSVVYGVTKNIVCKMIHNVCPDVDIQMNCMDSFEEAAITMELSKCDYITRLYYATLGVNTVNKRYTCYMFMERATLSLDVVFPCQDSSRHNWLKPIVEHDTLQALAYMHKHGFVHRDLKFNNMLLFIQGGHAVIKLCDLGCSQLGYSATSRSGDMYRAPPEVLIYPLYSPASDMFSWALVMWTMYTGIIPFYQKEHSFYSITRKLFTIVGCYQNMAKYDNPRPNLKGSKHLCGHGVCTLNSHKEFTTIAKDLYTNYHAALVPEALTPLLVTNMSIFPQRRYTAEDLLGHKRYTIINGNLIHRTVSTRREQLDRPDRMPGLLFDRESEPMKAVLVERTIKARKVKTYWSNKHKTYYGHEHYNITDRVSLTNKLSARTKVQASKIMYLTTQPADNMNDMSGPSNARGTVPGPGNQKQAPRAAQKRQKNSSPNSSSGFIRKIHKLGQTQESNPVHKPFNDEDENMVSLGAPADNDVSFTPLSVVPGVASKVVPSSIVVASEQTDPSAGYVASVNVIKDLTEIPVTVIDLTDNNDPAFVSVDNLDDSPGRSPPRAPTPVHVTDLPTMMLQPTEIPNLDGQTAVDDDAGKKKKRKKKSKTEPRSSRYSGIVANEHTRSRSLLRNESEAEHRTAESATQVDVLTRPKYFLRTGYPDNCNIRDVIYKTDIVIGHPFLPWYNHYMYVIGLPQLTKVSVLPMRDSGGVFMVYPFAQGPTCGVMYVTANIGNPLYKYVADWRKSHNKQTYHTIFSAAVCQLTTIMSKLQKLRIIPKRPLYLGDLWWNKVTKTVRLDLFNIAITNELVVNSDNPFSVWGRPLLYQLAKMCELQKLVGDTIEDTMATLQKRGYSLKLMIHTTYMPDMVAGFRPQDPMANTPAGSWCK